MEPVLSYVQELPPVQLMVRQERVLNYHRHSRLPRQPSATRRNPAGLYLGQVEAWKGLAQPSQLLLHSSVRGS
mgnify:CR=1 FL=1